MAEIVVFHNAQGRTSGVADVADRPRAAGHQVHLPDLYDGRTFEQLDDGVGHADAVGFSTIIDPFFAGEGDLDAAP